MFASRKASAVRRPHQARRRESAKPTFERLEERQHFSVYTVTNTHNSGAGSLRDAIVHVNAGNDSVIDFNIPTTDRGYESADGMWTINLISDLPTITRAVTIDGYTQNGSTGGVIDINGDHIMGKVGIIGLNAAGGHSTIRGLDLDNFDTAIELSDASIGGDVIDGNGFGEYNGQRQMQTAITVEGPNCEIGTNAKNLMYPVQAGIALINSSGDTVSNNQIFSGNEGVLVQGNSGKDTISNNTVQAGSVTGQGVSLQGGATGNTVSGNMLEMSNVGVFMDWVSGGNTVVGNSIGDCNTGMLIESSGNTIGTLANGNNVNNSGTNSNNPGYGNDGIDICGDSNNIDGNTLVGNQGFGIRLMSVPGTEGMADGNTIQANTLAGDDAGEIAITNGSHGNLIGGYSDAADANVISQDSSVGVYVSGSSYDNAIVGNSISMLGNALGINTNTTGNNGQAAPVITASGNAREVSISGTVQSYADTAVRIEVFASPANHEGKTYIGTETVMTNASGQASFRGIVDKDFVGDFITATATVSKVVFNFSTHRIVSLGGTSEFSNGVHI